MQQMSNFQFRLRKNNQIRISPVRLINSEGINVGVVTLQEALKQAKEVGLDLIEINAKSSPPVVKIADYGKMMYEEKKKVQAAKKNQVIQELKEITFRPNTDDGDLNHKLEQAKQFLTEGNRVKFTVRFRGREITHPDIAKAKLDWIQQQLVGLIQASPSVSLEGKFMYLVVSPIKK